MSINQGTNVCSGRWIRTFSPGHVSPDIFPMTFPLPDNFPSLFTWCRTFPFHHHRSPIYDVKRSTVNVYKIDSGRISQLHWLDVVVRVRFRICVQVFRCLQKMAPEYLSTYCQPVSGISGCETCFVRRTFICIHRPFELELTSCLP